MRYRIHIYYLVRKVKVIMKCISFGIDFASLDLKRGSPSEHKSSACVDLVGLP